MRCGAACKSPEARRQWGCDGPAQLRPGQRGVFHVPCWACNHEGGAGSCAVCDGFGRVWQSRCPTALWEPWLSEFLRSLVAYRDGHLPAAGGMNDQAQPWSVAVRVAMSHVRRCESTLVEREAKKPPRA